MCLVTEGPAVWEVTKTVIDAEIQLPADGSFVNIWSFKRLKLAGAKSFEFLELPVCGSCRLQCLISGWKETFPSVPSVPCVIRHVAAS